MRYFFTADQHFGHVNIIKYTNRPFKDVSEMNTEIIRRHNEVVGKDDTVVHAGDFAWGKHDVRERYIEPLNGHHMFVKGSHDRWLRDEKQIMELNIEGQHIVVCHYAMRVWPRSHYNSWQVYGHSHGKLKPAGKQWDVGVDNNQFYPIAFEELRAIMDDSPDNFNLVKGR